MSMRVFIDTEFTNLQDRELISIALVAENGTEFYGESSDFDRSRCSGFVQEVVLPQLGMPAARSMPYLELRREVQEWLRRFPRRDNPVICYDYDGDLKLLEVLIGGGLPPGWRHESIWSKIDSFRQGEFFAEHGHRHHALWDARANCASVQRRAIS
ncbi:MULTISPECIES: 3'-5' exoribonuclease [unclassified Caballeronia]|uniref:3'-5' exoribonuclease n=1 Tax=unclassified Caballeronia TaxID=2646786 RepID=UPI0020287E53|nr:MULTISPECIES: 3'-5' exoribonuclease [unclassified Caballeronia]